MSVLDWSWRFVTFWVARMPRCWSLALSRLIGDGAYFLMPLRRRVAKEKIAHMLGKPPGDPEVGCIARQAFQNFARYARDFVLYPHVSADELEQRITIEGRRQLGAALALGAAEPASFMLIAPATSTPFVCVTAPVMFDPPDGKSFAAKNTILRWRTDYALNPDEEFAVMAWMEGDAQPTLLAKTRDKTAPIDLLQWAFAGRFGKFFRNVRLQRTDGRALSCPSPAFSFTLTGYPSGAAPAPPGQQPPKPPCPAGIVCPP